MVDRSSMSRQIMSNLPTKEDRARQAKLDEESSPEGALRAGRKKFFETHNEDGTRKNKKNKPAPGNAVLPRKTPAAKTTGMMKGGMAKYAKGGLKEPTEAQAGVKKLPSKVRNRMGFMKKGGDVKKMNMGGMAGMDDAAMMAMKKRKKAMAGMGAPTMMKEGGTAKKPKVRGAGIARKGVRPAKMR